MIGMNWGIAGAIITYLIVVLIMSLQPYINARMVLFGVFVPEGFRDHKKVRNMKKSFTIIVWLTSIATAAIVWGLGEAVVAESAVLIPIIIALQPLSTLLVLWKFRINALRLKNEQNWQAPPDTKRVASLNFPRRKSTIGNVWFSFHLIIVAVCVLCAALSWDSIPSTLITHYGMDGVADRFSDKSFLSVFSHNFIQIGMLVIFIFANFSIRMSKQGLDPNNPELSMGKQVRFRRIMSWFLWGLSLVIVAFIGIIQGSILYEWSSKTVIAAAIALPVLLLGSTIGLSVYLSRKKLDQQSDGTTQNDHYWKIGVFYVNADDPALFVSKRTGIGWTLNFGHRISWVIFIGTIAIPIVAIPIIISIAIK
jgi:uncharacterized membrane protein